MEQNILKRYHEIHTMLWEEVIKVFSARTSKIRGIEYYKTNTEQIETLYIASLKRTALFNLFVRGKITEEEKNNLLMNANCAACYVAGAVRSIEFIIGNANWYNDNCEYCPIKKWNAMNMHCNDYHTVEDRLDYLIRYITNCITHREKFNLGAYMSLRKSIMKKMYIVAHLEWGYEEMKYEEYNITEVEINDVRKYMAECIKKLNKGVRINLRNAILRRLGFLEWRYEE